MVKYQMGTKINPSDTVQVDGTIRKSTDTAVYLALNKPKGVVCTTDTRVENNIIDFLAITNEFFPIGRLDKDSQGLILLTNDGDIVNKILRARNNHEKEYIVTVDKADDRFIKNSRGVLILDTITRPCKVMALGQSKFKIILTQGLNRQIRRMQIFRYQVRTLTRIRIMNIHLDVKLGDYRELKQSELQKLNKLLADFF